MSITSNPQEIVLIKNTGVKKAANNYLDKFFTDVHLHTTHVPVQGKYSYEGYKLSEIQHKNISSCPEGKQKMTAEIHNKIQFLQDLQR